MEINKLSIILFFCLALILTSCAKQISQEEAQNIAYNHVKEQLKPTEPVTTNKVFFADDGWHAHLLVGDDELTVLMTKTGKVQRLHAYEWI